MLKTYISRVAAGAVISAAVTAGSLGLTATAAGASIAINCPPSVAAATSSGGGPGC